VPRFVTTGLVGLLAAGVLAVGAVAVRSQPSSASAVAAAPVVVPRAPVVQRATRSRPVLAVAPVHATVVPDLLVTTARPLTPVQVVALRRIRGVTASTPLLRGDAHIGGQLVHALGVDPSSFRRFTPRETAFSDPLWAAVARGDLAPDYGTALPLGATLQVSGRPLRVGAKASYGVPGADLLVNEAVGRSLRLQLRSMLLAAPDRGIKNLTRDVRAVLGEGADVEVLRPVPITYRRPATYRELYQLSASYCPGLSWTVLSAIGQIESGHGRNVGPSTAGALGPMQFMPATWAFAGVDGDGDGKADIMSPFDAVPAAALYLCRNGAGRGGQALYNAIYSYNHADWYVREVLDLAARYR
jgi:hypothetical protein